MGFLLNHLGFLDPITTSLPLITFRTYWTLCQPNEFTNSFPRLPNPFTSCLTLIILMGLLFHSLGFPSPFTSSLPLIILVGLLSLLLPFQPVRLAWLFSLLTFFILLGFFCYWTLCQKWASTRIIGYLKHIENPHCTYIWISLCFFQNALFPSWMTQKYKESVWYNPV